MIEVLPSCKSLLFLADMIWKSFVSLVPSRRHCQCWRETILKWRPFSWAPDTRTLTQVCVTLTISKDYNSICQLSSLAKHHPYKMSAKVFYCSVPWLKNILRVPVMVHCSVYNLCIICAGVRPVTLIFWLLGPFSYNLVGIAIQDFPPVLASWKVSCE